MLTDYFDNEPSPGGQYEKVIETKLVAADNIPRRIIKRFRGRPLEGVSVALEELRDGVTGILVRYDNSHGVFHRHAPGWPEPGNQDAEFPKVSIRQAAAFADNEIRACYASWEAKVFGQERDDYK